MVWMRVRSDPEITTSPKKKKNKKKNQPIQRPENELNSKIKIIPEESTNNMNNVEEKPKVNEKQKTEEKVKNIRANDSSRNTSKHNVSPSPVVIKKPPVSEDIENIEKEKSPVIEEKEEKSKIDEGVQVDDLPTDFIKEEESSHPKATDLSDDEIPEWANEEITHGNLNDDYTDMVTASADIFSSRAETPASTSSQSSLSMIRTRKSDTDFTTDDTEHSRATGELRNRRQKTSRSKKKDKDKETKRYLDMMTKKFRETLEEALRKGEKPAELDIPKPPPKQEENLSWPLSMYDQNQMPPMMNMQQMYMHYINQWNQYQAAFGSRPYGYYEPMLDTLYEGSNTAPASRGFSSDPPPQPAGNQVNSFHSTQLGPIGARPNTQTNTREEPFSSLLPSTSDGSSLLGSTSGNSRQYNLFTGDDPIWQPLLDDLRSSTSNDWPDLKDSKSKE